MLLWAIFTLGFMFGVFFTLVVFVGDKNELLKVQENLKTTHSRVNRQDKLNPWEVHAKLVKPNVENISETEDTGNFSVATLTKVFTQLRDVA